MTAPDTTPQGFAHMLERASAMATTYLRELPERAAFRLPPDDVVQRFRNAPLPTTSTPANSILDDIERDVLPYALGLGHPRWWGFVRTAAAPVGAAAELLAATMNNNCAGSGQVATHVELTVVRWLAQLIGYTPEAAGILMSGGSAANFVALAAMREAMLPGVRHAGLMERRDHPTVYASTEVHSCVGRALELLGLGSEALRLVPVDAELRLDVAALERTIAQDRAAGRTPLAVVATAGTVNTGVIDPLARVADLTAREGLWFHVDGAYGAVGAALPELAERYEGLERADSVVLDPHKWLYTPYEAGAVLVKHRDVLARAFATRADYLEVLEDDYFSGPVWYHEYGPQLSRGFRALKVWAVMRHIGLERYRELWRQDIRTAHALAHYAQSQPPLEVGPAGDLSVCCFRYVPASGDADRFNRSLLDAIHRDGRAFVSGTTLGGRFYLRACIINFRSTEDDARLVVETVVELAQRLETGAP